MVDKVSDIQPEGHAPGVMPYQQVRESDQFEAETDEEAEARGPDDAWTFWSGQIKAGLVHERRWRHEGTEAEIAYFGEDNDVGDGSSRNTNANNKIDDKTALIHANIDVLKPLMYSETPQPVVRRRFRGDGKTDETDAMAAECGQRLAQYILDTEKFDKAMMRVRDDWLVPGRGAARIHYKADIQDFPVVDPTTGTEMIVSEKISERVGASGLNWKSFLVAPADSWEQAPWIAFEISTTRGKFEQRFGKEKAANVSFTKQGLVNSSNGQVKNDRDRDTTDVLAGETETGKIPNSPFDTIPVWEIWSKETREVIWWCESYTDGVLDREDDPLGLEDFWPMPEPLLASTKNDTLTPRPDIKYYEVRAREVEVATKKLRTILDALSVSGLIPGEMGEEIQKLFDGESKLIPIAAWLKLIEKGGTNNIIQWLPIDKMISVAQALITMRDQSKQAMFEASGVSDVMRAQGDPNETATAQQIKGRYAGLRLSERQRRIAIYARDLLRLMIEVALEHFDTETLADICGLGIPMTEAERQAMIAEQQMAMAQYQEAAQLHQIMAQAVEAGQLQGPMPPAPQEPEFDRVPETSWELVHERLRTDYGRKITLTIETQSTVLADEQADKEARIEFLSAFATFVAELSPLMATGQFDAKTVKELLMFGVRGFPKSRTLESMIADLPDEPQGEAPEDPSVTVAKIKAEVDLMIAKMEAESDRMKEGVKLAGDAAKMAAEPSTPQPAATPR